MGDMLKLGPVGKQAEGASWDAKGQRNLYQLFISYDVGKLQGLQVQYIDEESSNLVLSEVYGKMSGSNLRTIQFDYPSEYITWLKIEGPFSRLGWLALKTNLGNCHGPFPNQSHIEINNKMQETGYYLGEKNQFGGFHGTADTAQGLLSLGVYLQPVSSMDLPEADISSHVAGAEALEID